MIQILTQPRKDAKELLERKGLDENIQFTIKLTKTCCCFPLIENLVQRICTKHLSRGYGFFLLLETIHYTLLVYYIHHQNLMKNITGRDISSLLKGIF